MKKADDKLDISQNTSPNDISRHESCVKKPHDISINNVSNQNSPNIDNKYRTDYKISIINNTKDYFDTSQTNTNLSINPLNLAILKKEEKMNVVHKSNNNLTLVKVGPSKVPSILASIRKDTNMKEYLSTHYKKGDSNKKERKFKEIFSNVGQFSKVAKLKFKPRKEASTRPSRIDQNDFKNDFLIPKEENNEKNITSYLLILALSIHAAFEGIALGLQDKPRDMFYMLLAIAFHKWVEALSIGIHLNKSQIDKETVIKLIVCFSLMTPVGCILGICLSGISTLLEASFLSISAGSFIYISASEVIVEEFSVSKYKLEKFLAFLGGAAIICFMTVTEHKH